METKLYECKLCNKPIKISGNSLDGIVLNEAIDLRFDPTIIKNYILGQKIKCAYCKKEYKI
ncbi:MAG: hypothetical protein PHN56_02175 [Candidatus Nanoarchaeia archaeon]|nr:hypothetical protein [Candidatus Nanoarchaeia archaeon]